jgi:hypothetical protein
MAAPRASGRPFVVGDPYAHLMAKGDWPKSYIVPSLALTGTAAGFLTWRVFDPAAHVDGWTVMLIVVAFLPWLRTVFESIEFPGGGSVKWRHRVEAEQVRQAADIRALRFLIARFLTKDEREMLQQFSKGDPIPANTDGEPSRSYAVAARVSSLKQMGLIDTKPEILEIAHSGESREFVNFNELYDVTDSGRQYLDLLDTLPPD